MSTDLAKAEPNQERTRLTLADCSQMDEFSSLADLAEEMQAYFKQAERPDAAVKASRLRLHLERRLGQTLKSAAANAKCAGSRAATSALTLSVLGIPRDRVSRAVQLADLPEPEMIETPAQTPASADEPSTEDHYVQPWSFEEFMRDE